MLKIRIVFSFIIVLAFVGCNSNPDEKFRNRYNRFVSLLNNSELKLVKAQKYKDASVLFENRLKTNEGLRKKYDDIKDFEKIKFHNTEMVFVFFFKTIKKNIGFYKDLLKK